MSNTPIKGDTRLIAGYRPGILAGVLQLHMDYYAITWGFGQHFESKVAAELAEFLGRCDDDNNLMLRLEDEAGRLIGSISIDAGQVKSRGAHLRWFIVNQSSSGQGAGRELMNAAIKHCDNLKFPSVYLTTFKGLDAARALYESFGFQLVDEASEDQWQGGVIEQRFERWMTTSD